MRITAKHGLRSPLATSGNASERALWNLSLVLREIAQNKTKSKGQAKNITLKKYKVDDMRQKIQKGIEVPK